MPRGDQTSFHLCLGAAAPSAIGRIALWRDLFGGSGRILVPDQAAAGFHGEFRSRTFGVLRLVEVSANSFRIRRDAAERRRMARDHVLINVVERGHIVGRLAGRTIQAAPGALLTSRLFNLMDVELRDATWLGLLVPRDVVERHLSWPVALDGRLFPAGSMPAVMIGHHLRALLALPDPLPSAREVAQVTRLVLPLVLGCLTGQPLPAPFAEVPEDPSRAVRRLIASRLGDPALGPDLIGRALGLSRSRLYRLMGDRADIASTIRRLRLRGAYRDIVSADVQDRTIEEIAACWGLSDPRGFRRAFGQEFGLSPAELRRRVRSGTVPPLPPNSTPAIDMSRWLEGF